MAEVYVARTKGIGGFEKLVAIKVIHPRFSEDQHFVDMLVEEAKISVQLNHVNIAQTFDLGLIDDTYFIAMELIEGADTYRIEKRARDQKLALPIDLCVYVASEVLNGLGYAHRKRDSDGQPMGIVHRDISPQNVLVSYSGEVKLVDFGIAKAALRGGQTEVGVIKGKYYYMSPEQAWGDPVDPRTDVFATGLLLHELLTGEMVYQEDNIPRLLDRVRKAEVPSPRAKRPEVPEELAQMILRATAKEAADRYPSATAFSQDLSRWLYGSNPTFTAQKLAQLMATLFPEEVKRHSQVLKLPTAEEEAEHARAQSKSAEVLPPMQRQEFGPAATNSVIFDLAEVDELTRNDILPFRRGRAADKQTRPLAAPSRPAGEDPWDEQTQLKDDGGWDDSTFVNDGGAPAAGGEELEAERTVAMASFPELMDAAPAARPIPPPPRRSPPKSVPPPGRLPPRPPSPHLAAASSPRPAPSSEQTLDEEVEELPAERTLALAEGVPELPAEKTIAFTEGAPAPPPRRGAIAQPTGKGMRLGPEAARFFNEPTQPLNAKSAPTDPFAPAALEPTPVMPQAEPTPIGAPGFDPFVYQPPPVTGADEELGKPQPLKWIALGALVVVVLTALGTVLALLLSGPADTSLQIISVPDGASVRLGDAPLDGVTPITVEALEPGQTIELEITHPGFEPHRASFAVTEGSNRRVFLLNQIRATLRVETDPPGAQVWIDDELRGTAPLDITGLPAGRVVRVRASAPGRGEVRQDVTIGESDRAPSVRLALPPAP